MATMEQHKSYDPDRTVTINAGQGSSPGLILGVLGFLASLVSVISIGLLSLDIATNDLESTPPAQQEQETSNH